MNSYIHVLSISTSTSSKDDHLANYFASEYCIAFWVEDLVELDLILSLIPHWDLIVCDSLITNIQIEQVLDIMNKHQLRQYLWILGDCPTDNLNKGQSRVRHISFDDLARISNKEYQIVEKNYDYFKFHSYSTRLPNLGFLLQNLEIKRNKSFALLYLDIDNFKTIKYSINYECAQKLLVLASHRLAKCLRKEDVLVHINSDEFSIILDNVNSFQGVKTISDKIFNEFSYPFDLGQISIYSKISVGVVLSHQKMKEPEKFLQAAELAMHHAKKYNKGDMSLYSAAMELESKETFELEIELQKAINKNQLSLVYQPIVNLTGLKIIGFEALMRWYHPKKGFIPPAKFIPIAETTGLIKYLDQWLIQTALSQLKEWQNYLPQARYLSMSLNLSPSQLTNSGFLDLLEATLKELNLLANRIKIEITENMLMSQDGKAQQSLCQLQQKGIEISIDDFGTGYSSLSYLHTMPINNIKIDRSFLASLSDDEPDNKDYKLLSAILNLAHSLDLTVIAEGIETQKQLQILRNFNCQYGQGYLFSRPVAASAALSLLMK